jgi:DNA repair protein RadA/Sms
MDTTDAELNRVLGGGIVPGSLIFGRRTRNGKNPLLQISLKLPYKLYTSLVKKAKKK